MARGFESGKKAFERSPAGEKALYDWGQLRRDVKSALKGIGLGAGSAALGVAIGFGTAEKKDKDGYSAPQQSASAAKGEARPVIEAIAKQEPGAAAPDSSPLETAEAALQEQQGKGKLRSRIPDIERPIVKDYRYYQELAEVKPSYIFYALDDLPDLPQDEARQLLWTAKENTRDASTIFQALPEIRELDIFSEREFGDFVADLIEKNPTAYSLALRAENIAKYLPQDAETVLRAAEQDPLAFAETEEGARAEA